jgi:hypothetical protein
MDVLFQSDFLFWIFHSPVQCWVSSLLIVNKQYIDLNIINMFNFKFIKQLNIKIIIIISKVQEYKCYLII